MLALWAFLLPSFASIFFDDARRHGPEGGRMRVLDRSTITANRIGRRWWRRRCLRLVSCCEDDALCRYRSFELRRRPRSCETRRPLSIDRIGVSFHRSIDCQPQPATVFRFANSIFFFQDDIGRVNDRTDWEIKKKTAPFRSKLGRRVPDR